METEDILKWLNLLLSAGPEAIAMFIVLDVRQVNLTGLHIGQVPKLAGNGSTGGSDNQKPTNSCPYSNGQLTVLYDRYMVAYERMNIPVPLSYVQWLAQTYPQCVS